MRAALGFVLSLVLAATLMIVLPRCRPKVHSWATISANGDVLLTDGTYVGATELLAPGRVHITWNGDKSKPEIYEIRCQGCTRR